MKAAVKKNPSTEIPSAEPALENPVMFTKEELAHFIEEVNLQFAGGNGINFGKAVRNARYLAKLDRGFADIKSGNGTTMTFDELERFIDEERSF